MNEEDMNSLTFKDLLILKRFLEKATRCGIFLQSEKYSVEIITTKLENIIKEVGDKK